VLAMSSPIPEEPEVTAEQLARQRGS
jgi:hypothetical protein